MHGHRKHNMLLFLFCIMVGYLQASVHLSTIKIACIGDSITYGSYLQNPETESYPAQLQSLLSRRYEVKNFGVSGACIARYQKMSYVSQQAFEESLLYDADIILIMLGTNDSMDTLWNGERQCIADLLFLLKQYQQYNQTRIILMTPSSSFVAVGEDDLVRGMKQRRIIEIAEIIRDVASEQQLEIIDIEHRTAEMEQYYRFDGVHPDASGAQKIAQEVANYLKENK